MVRGLPHCRHNAATMMTSARPSMRARALFALLAVEARVVVVPTLRHKGLCPRIAWQGGLPFLVHGE